MGWEVDLWVIWVVLGCGGGFGKFINFPPPSRVPTVVVFGGFS